MRPEKIENSYQTPPDQASFWGRNLPTMIFYQKMFSLLWEAASVARKGKMDNKTLILFSSRLVGIIECCGICLDVQGIAPIIALQRPVVIVANHMSTLETFALPWVCSGIEAVSFVIKKSLTRYPFFRHVLKTLNPICVSRISPRKDLETVFEQGAKRLEEGRSVIIFPQTTRQKNFMPNNFSSIGTKLAARAGVPLVPLALKTDAWGMGIGVLKDFGRIFPQKTVYFHFGSPLFPQSEKNANKAIHAASVQFIAEKTANWKANLF